MMKFVKSTDLLSIKDAVVRCYETHMCAALSNCGTGNDTATINAENYESVKAAFTPNPSPPTP